MLTLDIIKCHGSANRFVMTDLTAHPDAADTDLAALARALCAHPAITPCDGVLYVVRDANLYAMRMFNPDGSEAEMCGNASRCIGKYVYDKGLTTKTDLTLETLAGVKHLTLHLNGNIVERVTVDMGEPILSPQDIPVAFPMSYVVSYPLEIENISFDITCVSMGNPHAVIFVDDMSRYDLHHIGALIEHYPLFPRRTNVEFVEILSPDSLKMRVWERGTGETMACGTGACASLVAAVLNGKSRRQATLHLQGGDLQIEWNEKDNHVYMTGDAVTVFEGEWPDDK